MKRLRLSLYEKIWFVLFTVVGVVLSFIWGDTIVGFVAFVTGIICVLLAAKGSKWNYIIGIINCLTYSWVCYQVGLFGDVIENMTFYLPLQFVGFYFWGKKTKVDGIVEMKKLKIHHLGIVAAVSAVAIFLFGLFLSTLKRQVNPYIDSLTNVLTIAAALLMLKRFREYWLFYIAVNLSTVLLWIIRMIDGSPDSVTVLVMWSAYLVNSIYGAYVWYKGTKNGDSNGKRIGLTLGKYAPFHKGHEYVIETMLRETDEAIVIIYDTSLTPIPLQVRTGWIKKLFPDVTVIEAWDGPVGSPHSCEYEIQEEQYILNLLDGKKITAFYSSEYYGKHISKALKCADRRIDEARKTVPVSATVIRDNPFQHKQYLSDIVYRDMITKAVFLGAMSTGKSTIAEALAMRYNTTFVREYGRDYWDEHQVDRRLSLEAFNEIATGHIEREEMAFLSADRYCFIDTNAITTYMFALDYHDAATELLTQLALENASRYDLFFLCEDDIPYDDTWDRSGNQKRHIFQKQIVADLEARRIPYISLKGDLETRMKRVDEVLNKFLPYSNFYGRMI